MKRREFLRQTSLLAAGALSAPSLAHARGPKRYDIIIVGAGAAGSIVARRLVDRFPGKSILLLEAGGPTSVTVGGRDFPPYDPHATIFDVPGEYTNIAFQPKGEPYRQRETPFTYQGTGYGGNSQFNGMLFQAAPPFDFDEAWPRGWTYADIRPYFAPGPALRSPGRYHHGRCREGERPPHPRAGAGPPTRFTMNTRTRGAVGAPAGATCSAPR